MATNKEIIGAILVVIAGCYATGQTVYKLTGDVTAQYIKLDEKITTNQAALIDRLIPLTERLAKVEEKIQKVSEGCQPMKPEDLILRHDPH